MEFNGMKFEAIKYGKNTNLKNDYIYYNSDCSETIGDVDNLRDLGIILSSDGMFTNHINKIISKCEQKIGWINKSIIRDSIELKRTIWRPYLQSLVDYDSHLWARLMLMILHKFDNYSNLSQKGSMGL